MSKGTIAFICPRFAVEGTVGGAETLLKRLAELAAQSGRRVVFLTTCAKNHFTWQNELPAGNSKVGDIEVIRFPVDENRDVDTFLRVQDAICTGKDVSREDEESWVKNSVNSQALYDHLRKQGGEYERVVMGPYLFGLIHTAALIVPDKTLLVPCLHDEPFAYLSVFKDVFSKVRGFLFNSEPERDLARRLFDVPAKKCSVVGMDIKPAGGRPDAEAFARRHGIRGPYVIYSGRRESGKGIPLMTDYMLTFRERTGRDLKLVFTGSGPIEAPHALQPHIVDLGFVSEEEKREAMAGAQVFIHPSIMESFGIVLLESFLCGTPALVHGRSEVLRWQCQRSQAGLWFRTYPEFEEALAMLLDKPELRRSMGEAGRRYVEAEYATAKVAERFLAAVSAP
jgi:glycosyltransferase involved in cell wall biosynthesis